MAGRHGAAVVLDVHTGRVLAAYHPDVAARRVVHPGSSIKPFTLAGAARSRQSGCSHRAGVQASADHRRTSARLHSSRYDGAARTGRRARLLVQLVFHQRRHATHARRSCATASCGPASASVTGLAPNEASGDVALAQSPEQLQLQAIGEWGISVTPLELLRAYRDLALLSQKNSDAQTHCLAVRGPAGIGSLWHGARRATSCRR